MVASRMQRWAIILSAYDFQIEYIRTNENGADGLSRLPIGRTETRQLPEQTYLHFVQDALLLNYNEIKRETLRDPLLSRILAYFRDGWPGQCEIVNLKPYFSRINELYEELGCVMWGHRLVVPETCRNKVLNMVHEAHMGIVKSKSIARSYVWWPGVDEDVEQMCRECEVCATQADNPPQNTLSLWPWPSRPWARLHLDFMGPISGRTYLVVVDAMSKWIEVFDVHSTTAKVTINRLYELFSRWGIPKQIVSDNGPQFACKEFQEFTKANGIEHIFTAPYHPASNGLAENAVRTLKRVINKAVQSKQDVNRSLWTFLLNYRNVEHSTTGECPAMLMLGRRIRTRLDIIRPDRERRVFRAQQCQREAAGGGVRQMSKGGKVWYRQFQGREKWAPGNVRDCLGARDYNVLTRDGTLIHRHIDQLRDRISRSSSPSGYASRMWFPNTRPPPGHGDRELTESNSEQSGGHTHTLTQSNRTLEPQPGPSNLVQTQERPHISEQSSDPSVDSTAQGRPIRQCRLSKPPIYKN